MLLTNDLWTKEEEWKNSLWDFSNGMKENVGRIGQIRQMKEIQSALKAVCAYSFG